MNHNKFNRWVLNIGFILMLAVLIFALMTAVVTDWYFGLGEHLQVVLKFILLGYCVVYALLVPYLYFSQDQVNLSNRMTIRVSDSEEDVGCDFEVDNDIVLEDLVCGSVTNEGEEEPT